MIPVLRRFGRALPTLALVVLVLVIAAVALLSFGVTTGADVEVTEEDGVALDQYRVLTLGSSREEVEQRIGPGRHALDPAVADTGAALEPIDGDCVYYPQAGTGNFRDIVQLCFRDDRLARKRTYAATPGLPLVGDPSAPDAPSVP